MTAWMQDSKHWKPNSAGYRMPGYEYALLDQDEKGHGEVAMVGRHVFMGYLNDEGKTRETFDSEYRLKSGDIGYTDQDGFLFISGRIKGLCSEIITLVIWPGFIQAVLMYVHKNLKYFLCGALHLRFVSAKNTVTKSFKFLLLF